MGARLSFVAMVALVGCSDAHLNEPPVLSDFTIEAHEDAPVTVMVAATDPENDDLLVELATPPEHGLAVLTGGALTYTPNADYNGADSLTVTVYDHKNPRITATASITVAPGNDAPMGANDIIAAAEDMQRTVAASTLLSNDSDIDGDALSITAVSGATDGTVSLTGTDIVFTPSANFSGTAGFQYTLSDGTATAMVSVEVDVGGENDAPIAVDDVATTTEDTPIDITTLLANDTDPDGQSLALVSVTSGTGCLVSHSGDTVSFTPIPDFHGSATFTYVVTDGVLNDTGAVTVTVTSVNDAPVAANDVGTTAEDTPITFSSLVNNDSDVDGDTLTVSAVANPINGTVAYNSGQPIFTPTANYNGSASFEYTVSDGAGGTDTGLVTVTVTAVNDPPVAVDDMDSTSEDTAIVFSTLADNDTDVEGATLTITAVSNCTNCTVSLNGGNPLFTPNHDFNGTATFDYTVSDGAGGTDVGTVTVNVASFPDVTFVAPNAVSVLASGGTAILRVDLDSDPGPGGIVIDLVSSSPANIAVPSTVTVPNGSLSATFRIRADATTASGPYTVTASLAGTGSSATSSVNVVTSASAPGTLDLVLNEVNYFVDTSGTSGDANCDGTADASQDEFFELSNRSSAPVQLSGVSFWDATAFTGSTTGYTFGSFILGPGEVVVVFSGLVGTTNTTSPWCTNLDGSHIGDARAFGANHTFGLNNTGETVHLTATASNSSTELVTAVTMPSGTAGQAYARNPDFTGGFVKDGIGIGAADRTISPGTLITGAPFASAGP